MRLYLSKKEAELIRLCLYYDKQLMPPESQRLIDNILERMEYCFLLQKSAK